MTSVTRIGILGGTFDPVHIGHVDTALAAHRALALDRVLVMPSGTPPHRASPPAASRFHRFAMAALAVTGLPGLMVSDLEIGHTGPCYTFDTLARSARDGPGGIADLLHHRRRRVRGDRDLEPVSAGPRDGALRRGLTARPSGDGAPGEDCPTLAARMVPPAAPASTPDDGPAQAGDVADNRLKVLLVDAPTPDVSSTEVRRRLAAGQSIADLVPADVETYIGQHGLYSRGDAGARFGKSLA